MQETEEESGGVWINLPAKSFDKETSPLGGGWGAQLHIQNCRLREAEGRSSRQSASSSCRDSTALGW